MAWVGPGTGTISFLFRSLIRDSTRSGNGATPFLRSFQARNLGTTAGRMVSRSCVGSFADFASLLSRQISRPLAD